MKWINIAALALVCLLCFACRGNTEAVSDKQHAEDLMNQNRFVQAKTLLKKLNQNDPSDHEIAFLLATAYAGAVGLNVVDAWRMFETMFFQEKSAGLIDETQVATSEKSVQFEKETYRFFSTLVKDFSILGRLPSLNKSGRVEINEALLVLQSIGADKPNFFRAKLYSIFLNLFQFSGVLRDSFPNLPKETDLEISTIICEFNPGLFFQNIDLGLNYLNNAAESIDAVGETSSIRPNVKLHLLKESAAKLAELRAENESGPVAIFGSKSAIDQILCEKS